MPEASTMTRSWRTDSADAPASADPEAGLPATGGERPRRMGPTGLGCVGAAVASAWSRAFGRRASRFEDDLDRFAADLSAATDPGAIEAALIRLARRIAIAGKVELIRATGQRLDRDGRTAPVPIADLDGCGAGAFQDFRVRCGAVDYGILRLHLPGAMPRREGRPEIRRRLAMACTLAACALEGARLQEDWARASLAPDDVPGCDDPAAGPASGARMVQPRRDLVRDATFLNAVLPFALEQSRRHGEPVSLICARLDRLVAIRDLLGEPMADRLVRDLGELVVSMVRASDLVARLDDDRIVALLVRARGENAMKVARTIGHAVTDAGLGSPQLPGVSVAIGVAEFPAAARDAGELLEAADEAMATARAGGSRAPVLAGSRSVPMTSREGEVSSRCGRPSGCEVTS